MARFVDYISGSNAAVWAEAIGEVLGQFEDQRQFALASIYLSTAALFELNERFANLTGTVLEPTWQVETFREHLQEIIQASLMLSSSREGVSQVVAATTMVRPIIKSIALLRRWLLGFQYLPNRHFFERDGTIFAAVDGPYTFTTDNNVLAVSTNSGISQLITFPLDTLTASEAIQVINGALAGAVAQPFGGRLFIEANSIDASASVQIDKNSSTATDVFGFDTFLHQNAPAPLNSTGSLPTGWELAAPNGSISNPLSLSAVLFGIGPPQVRGNKDSPYHGLVTGNLLSNPGFELGFEEWDASQGPDFFISTTKSRTGHQALGIITTNKRTDLLRSDRLLVTPGREISLTGFHQAKASQSTSSVNIPKIFTSGPGTPTYNWSVANAIRHTVTGSTIILPGQGPTLLGPPLLTPPSPLADTSPPDAFPPNTTALLTDTSVDFIAAGVKAGMAIQVFGVHNEFHGVIVGVSVNRLIIDVWRTATNAGVVGSPMGAILSIQPSPNPISLTLTPPPPPTLTISTFGGGFGGGGPVVLHIQVAVIGPVGPNPVTIGTQFLPVTIGLTTGDIIHTLTGSFPGVDPAKLYDSFVNNIVSVMDKLVVTQGNRVWARDILAVSGHSIAVLSWGAGQPIPQPGASTFIALRPEIGSPYTIWRSLSVINSPTTTTTTTILLSAQFRYTLTFYDGDNNVVGTATTGFIVPPASDQYTPFSLIATTPATARSADITIEVAADPNGDGVLATVDDLVAHLDTPGAFLDMSNGDGRMQKIQFVDIGSNASGEILYTKAPSNGDRIQVGHITYEFDSGTLASGLITYSGNPADGDVVTVGTRTYQFANDITTIPGMNVGVQIAGTADATLANFVGTLDALDTTVQATQNISNSTVTLVTTFASPQGNNIAFTKSSAVLTIAPAGGTLLGGSSASAPSGIVSIFTYLPGQVGSADLPYEILTNAINIGNEDASATIDESSRIITVIARQTGPAGNGIVFSGISASPSFVLIPINGFLSVFTGRRAGGSIQFNAQPEPHESVIIDGVAFEFVNASGLGSVCFGAVPVLIASGVISGIAGTMANLVSAINFNSAAIAEADFATSRIIVTSELDGSAGNSDPFRSDSEALVLVPDQGDRGPQTATGTNSVSRTWVAALATYTADNTPPTVLSAGTGSSLASTPSLTVPITNPIAPLSRVIVAVSADTLDQDPTPPTVTDTSGGVYALDVERTGTDTGRAYIFSRQTASGLDITQSVIVSVATGNLNGVAVSVLGAATLCDLDQITTSSGIGTALSVGPTGPLESSGEMIVGLFSALGPNTDSFTPGPNYQLVGRVGTAAGAQQVTANPVVKICASSHLAGGADSLFANPDALTCAEVASFVNIRASGITASCEVVSGVFDNGRLVLTSSGTCMLIGHGDANAILGFPDDKGVCVDPNTFIPGWEVVAGQSGIVSYITRANLAARKFFGTTWHARFWAAATSPSGIDLSIPNLTSGVLAVATIAFDESTPISGPQVQLSATPQPVEVITPDFGAKFENIDVRLNVSGVASGMRIIMSDPYLINATSQSLHLADHTVPRNKQREYRLHRMFVADPDPFTVVEFGLLGLTAQRVEESVQLIGNASFQLRTGNIIQGSETVERAGSTAMGTIHYTGNPVDGNFLYIGTEIYEFDSNFIIGPNSIQVIITPTADQTMANLVDQINTNSVFATATLDTTAKVVTITAQQPGANGDNITFAAAVSGIFDVNPIAGTLGGGVDPTIFTRGSDYVVDYILGKIRRVPAGAIPDPSPPDLVIDYSYAPAGIDPSDSYPQQIKAVGSKIEADITTDLIFYGTFADFINPSGMAINLVPVQRVPSRFSYLKPVVRGLYQQVVVFSGIGFSAALDFPAASGLGGLLLQDGSPLPMGSTGWSFIDSSHIAILASEFEATSVYEFEYHPLFQATSAPIPIADTVSPYSLVPYSYKVRNAEEVLEDIQVVLRLDQNRVATLPLPAVQDQSIAELTKTIGGTTTEVANKFWQFVDDTHVEVLLGAFAVDAIFTLTYKASRIDFVSPVSELWEFATSSGVFDLTNFEPFQPGDVVELSDFVRFRVTATGDFGVNDYRVRSFAAIIDVSDLTTCGYGIGGYGITPYGCGLDVEAPPPLPPLVPVTTTFKPVGTMYLSGQFTVSTQAAPVPGPLAAIISTLGGGNGSSIINGTFYYGLSSILTVPVTLANVSRVQAQVTSDITLKSLCVRTTAVLDPGVTLQVNFYVNNVLQSGIQVNMSAGSQEGTASGSIALHDGDTLAVQVIIAGGSATISSITAGYQTST